MTRVKLENMDEADFYKAATLTVLAIMLLIAVLSLVFVF